MNWQIRQTKQDEIPEVIELAKGVFDQYEAPEYPPEGVEEFYRYITTESMAERLQSSALGFVAVKDQKIIGMIELYDNNHVSLLFVDPEFHGQGIGRALWDTALKKCQQLDPKIKKFTVHSSPYAAPIYEKLGFHKTGPEKLENGIRYIPMEFNVS